VKLATTSEHTLCAGGSRAAAPVAGAVAGKYNGAVNACTIVSRRELSRARVLASTLRDHNPDLAFTVLLLDADPRSVGEIAHARLLALDELAGEASGMLVAANSPDALTFAVLPQLLLALLRRGGESVVYLGCGQRVLGPLAGLAALLNDHQIALVARPAPDSSLAAFGDDRTRGAFSRELLGMRAGRATSDLLSIWPRYFAEDADGGAGAVRAWLDSVPALAEDVGVVRDAAYGADARALARLPINAEGKGVTVGQVPVLTFDFSEMDPHDPLSICDGEDRVTLSSMPALAELCTRHAEELLAAGYDEDATYAVSAFAELEGGVRLTPTMRRVLIEGIQADELTRSPFTAAGRRALVAYLNAPSARGRAFGLTRLHMAIWNASADLRAAYPHIDGPDGAGFAGWLCRFGAEQESLSAELLPPVPELAFRDADPLVHEGPPRWGVNVAGFFTAELGVGEAARLLIAGLDARGIPALPIQGHLIPPSRQGVEFAYAAPDEAAYPINIVCINGDGIPVFAREAGRSFFEGRHTIAMWWWEVGPPPREWDQAFDYIDEVWVASQYIHDLIAPISPVPVVKITMPVLMPDVAAASRSDLGLPQDGFVFLFVHDYHSVAARKNPAGLIEAFKRAFPPGSGAKLVVKSINASKLPVEHDRVVLASAEHPDITLIDAYVTAAEKNAMIAHCDCYVSLHRAEGFGLTVAEAMLLGKPVITTRFGGTLEFTNDENSYLVDCEPVAVGDRAGIYAADAIWAEPDLDRAAELMLRVFEHPADGRARGELACRQVSESHAPSVAGEAMERRLQRIHERMADEGARTLNPRHVPASEAGTGYPDGLGTPPQIEWGSSRMARLRRRAHRPVANWVRAYLEHESSIDARTFDRLVSLDARFREAIRTLSEQQQARHAETLAVLRRLESELTDLRGHDAQAPTADGDHARTTPPAEQLTDRPSDSQPG
jgi:glycosyltransferase involved in cell wall biosynthesis